MLMLRRPQTMALMKVSRASFASLIFRFTKMIPLIVSIMMLANTRACCCTSLTHALFLVSDPMFRFIVQKSPDCDKPTQFDLKKVAYLARMRDEEVESEDYGPKVLNLTAVAFHESRCGSTLVANSMIAMDPEKHRTYSESSPPIKALHFCDDMDRCNQDLAVSLFKDTVYLMSRTDDHREERLFFRELWFRMGHKTAI